MGWGRYEESITIKQETCNWKDSKRYCNMWPDRIWKPADIERQDDYEKGLRHLKKNYAEMEWMV